MAVEISILMASGESCKLCMPCGSSVRDVRALKRCRRG